MTLMKSGCLTKLVAGFEPVGWRKDAGVFGQHAGQAGEHVREVFLGVDAQPAAVFHDGVKSSGELMPDGSPILQVDTYPLTIYSAAAVQELHRENLALKKQVNDQEQRLRKLEELLKNR